MKNEHGFQDEVKNLFKLQIYEWNINEAIKYYHKDKFCHNYCIRLRKQPYGCKFGQKCKFQHTICMFALHRGRRDQRDYIKLQILCMYLMHTKIYNNTNPVLFTCYASVLNHIGKETNQTAKQIHKNHQKAAKYYLKALSIDSQLASAHSGYAKVLHEKLQTNYDKAEYHYKEALRLDPTSPKLHANFSTFLMRIQKNYTEALVYCEKALVINPKYSTAHYLKGAALKNLNQLNESLTEYEMALKCNEKDGKLSQTILGHLERDLNWINSRLTLTLNNDAGDLDADEKMNTQIKNDELSIVECIDKINDEIKQMRNDMDNVSDNTIISTVKASWVNRLRVISNQLDQTSVECDKSIAIKSSKQAHGQHGQSNVDALKDTLIEFEKKWDVLKQKAQSQQEQSPNESKTSGHEQLLPLLGEMKQFKKQSKVQKQTWLVCFVF